MPYSVDIMATNPEIRYMSTNVSPDPIGETLTFEFSGKTAPNRFCKAATTERLSSWHPQVLAARGIPSPRCVNLYRTWGKGRIGLIITGNIMIELDQLEAAGNLIVPCDCPFSGERFEAFKKLAAAGQANGSLMIGQVNHPGRQTKAALQKNPVSASDVQLMQNELGYEFGKPHAATTQEIEHIVEGFAHAAEFLEKAGFDGIQLHGAQ